MSSLLLFGETLPLATNGVKKNSCRQTDRRTWGRERTEKRKGQMPRAPHFTLKRMFSLIWHKKQLRHRKIEKLVQDEIATHLRSEVRGK